jgi:bacteriorhodopsin
MYAFIPVLIIAFIVIFFFAKRKDKAVKKRKAWMILVPCIAIIVYLQQFSGIDQKDLNDLLMPFSAAAGICVIWLIALSTQK